MLEEPEQGLTHRPKLGKLAKDQMDRLLHATIRILFQPLILGLQISHRCGRDQLSAPGFLHSGLDRALPQQIQFVFVETAF